MNLAKEDTFWLVTSSALVLCIIGATGRYHSLLFMSMLIFVASILLLASAIRLLFPSARGPISAGPLQIPTTPCFIIKSATASMLEMSILYCVAESPALHRYGSWNLIVFPFFISRNVAAPILKPLSLQHGAMKTSLNNPLSTILVFATILSAHPPL